MPTQVTVGVAVHFQVKAKTRSGNIVPDYPGTVNLTSSDPAATFTPSSSTLANGVGSFSVVLRTAGVHTIVASDSKGEIGALALQAVNAVFDHLAVVGPASAITGVGFPLTVVARDQFNNQVLSYADTITFSVTGGSGTLPSATPITGGAHTFSATLTTTGSLAIHATDTHSHVGILNVHTTGPATHYLVQAPANETAGVGLTFTVTAEDSTNATVTAYGGTVHFTSAASSTLPANMTLASGVGTFGATLVIAGNQTITATDVGTPTITGVSGQIAVVGGPANSFTIVLVSPKTAGTLWGMTVTARDVYSNTSVNYSGTVNITSSDTQATMPDPSTITSGSGFFAADLRTAGVQTISATDLTTATITGSAPITIVAAVAKHFAVSAPGTCTAGAGFSFTVMAEDLFNNVAPSYGGTATFASSDTSSTVPANYHFLPGDNGVKAFSATMDTVGSQRLTASDVSAPTMTGQSGAIAVSPAVVSHYVLLASPTTLTSEAPNLLIVYAKDQFNNVATGDRSTVAFTCTDTLATLPPAGSALNSGFGLFAGILRTAGAQTVTVTDAQVASITGVGPGITVHAGSATHLRITNQASGTTGTGFRLTTTAFDASNNTATGYPGTVSFSSTGTAATLPPNSTLTSGVGTFTATLTSTGAQTITATDVTTPAVTGRNSIVIS